MQLAYFLLAPTAAVTLPQVTVNLFHLRKLACLGARYHRSVLTAASCIQSPIVEYLAVIKTNHSLEFSGVYEIIPHPYHSDYHALYDLAILKTDDFGSPDPGLVLMNRDVPMPITSALLFGWYQPNGSWNHRVVPRRIPVRIERLESCQDKTLMMVFPYVVICGHTFAKPHGNFISPPGSPLLQYRGDNLILVGIKVRNATPKTRHIFAKVSEVDVWINSQT